MGVAQTQVYYELNPLDKHCTNLHLLQYLKRHPLFRLDSLVFQLPLYREYQYRHTQKTRWNPGIKGFASH